MPLQFQFEGCQWPSFSEVESLATRYNVWDVGSGNPHECHSRDGSWWHVPTLRPYAVDSSTRVPRRTTVDVAQQVECRNACHGEFQHSSAGELPHIREALLRDMPFA